MTGDTTRRLALLMVLLATPVFAGQWKAVRLKDSTPIELYDLESDIGERKDVAARHPEIVQRMQAVMEEAYSPPAR